jgi:hypothetical protein
MRKILVLLMLFSFNSVAFENDLLLINGIWDCSPEPDSEMILINTIEYRVKDMSFTHNGRVTFIQNGGVESTIESITVGTFEYKALVVEDKIDSIDIKIIKDESGFLKGAEESLRKAMLAESKPIVTKLINKNRWVRFNSETNETTECEKI